MPPSIDWFILRDARYDRLLPDADGVTRSEIFPGLWLDSAAMLTYDLARVHAISREGLAQPSHEAFAFRLAEAQKSR